MKRFYVLIVLIVWLSPVQAQESLLENEHWFNASSFNSAFIVDNDSLQQQYALTSVIGNGLQQTGRIHFMGSGRIDAFGMGLGLKFNSRFEGLLKTSSIEFLYAKEVDLTKQSRLLFGTNFGMHTTALNTSALNGYVELEDPALLNADYPQYRLTAGVGIAYVLSSRLKVGVSVPTLVRTNAEFQPSWIGNASYRFDLGDKWNITPQFMGYGTTLNIPVTGEFNCQVNYQQKVWVQLGARTTQTYIYGIGMQHNLMRIGYAYNMNTTPYQYINPGVHQINLTLQVGRKAPDRRLEELQKALREDREELKQLIESNNMTIQELNLQLDSIEDGIEEVKNAPTQRIEFYTVVGSVRELSKAKRLQKLLKKKYNLETDILLNDKRTWCFLYTVKSATRSACKKERERLKQLLKDEKVIHGEPWIYIKES